MFLLPSLILFVLHLFVNIKALPSCLANGRRDAQVEKSRKVENCFDFLRKVSLLSSTTFRLLPKVSLLSSYDWFGLGGGLRGLTH